MPGGALSGEDEESYGHWRRSGKMHVMESLLKMWKTHGHRVLVFSQSRGMLNILERFVKDRGYIYRRMDGTTSITTRQPLVNEFNQVKGLLFLIFFFFNSFSIIFYFFCLQLYYCLQVCCFRVYCLHCVAAYMYTVYKNVVY